MNKWTRRFELKANPRSAARRPAPEAHHYFAFLSYSHEDREAADRLHEELEAFRVPSSLAGRLTAHGVIPKRLTPIFRDQHDLAASHDLSDEIRLALAASRSLIVLCSPSAAASKWTNAEIDCFRRLHPDGCIVAAVIAGEPLAKGSGTEEKDACFPPALLVKYDRRGRPTGKTVEPLAADLRGTDAERRTGFLKIVAGILGVHLDDLVQRDHLRRQRRLALVTAGSLFGMVVASILAVTAIKARDEARDERRQAENLIGFMLGDLKDKLEPIGRLDALDGVGTRVLAYYHNQDTSELTDAALLQRSRALSLMGEVANARGDLETSFALYHEAAAGTAEAVERNPNDPQRLYEHAQNEFYLGGLAIRRGQLSAAEAAFREYKRLADRMVALAPDNMKWRMEQEDAEGNLAAALYQQRRFQESAAQWAETLKTIEALATADPNNADYQKSLVESLAWYADAESGAGRLQQAIAIRQRHIALLTSLYAKSHDVNYLQKLIPAERSLGNLYGGQGKADLALQHLRTAVEYGDRLMPMEPDNRTWIEFTARARLNLADQLLTSGDTSEAATTTEAGCSAIDRLLRIDHSVQTWIAGLRDCWALRSQVAMKSGSARSAVSDASQSVRVARTIKSSDAAADRYGVAKSYRLLGDARQKAGDRVGAGAAWQAALSAIPTGIVERPVEATERIEILRRLGRSAEAGGLASRLTGLGYRYPALSDQN